MSTFVFAQLMSSAFGADMHLKLWFVPFLVASWPLWEVPHGSEVNDLRPAPYLRSLLGLHVGRAELY